VPTAAAIARTGQFSTVTVNRAAAVVAARRVRRNGRATWPLLSRWRRDDPPSVGLAQLTPDDFGKRVIIRSEHELGTVFGTLWSVSPHPTLSGYLRVQLHNSRPLVLRADLEAVVVD
jgi:hypothetical protein